MLCTRCKTDKPTDAFAPAMRTYRSPRCRACVADFGRNPTVREYRRNWEKQKASDPAWRARRSEQHASWFRKTTYGVDRERFAQMLASQGHVCLLCGKPFGSEKGQRPAIDHDHETGLVRGVLHARCNSAIGFLDDDPQLLEQARFYLKWYGGKFR